jgi:uncharacterized protein YjgD (DUF1641 family)
MAKAIKDIDKQRPNSIEEQAQAIQQLIEMTAESRDALVSFLEILQELHSAGLLDIVQGLLKTRHKVGVLAMGQLNQPEMHRIIKNGINTIQFLGELEPDQLQTMLNGVNKGLEKSATNAKKGEQISLWGLAKSMRDPDVKMSVSTMMAFLEGMGKGIKKDQVH